MVVQYLQGRKPIKDLLPIILLGRNWAILKLELDQILQGFKWFKVLEILDLSLRERKRFELFVHSHLGKFSWFELISTKLQSDQSFEIWQIVQVVQVAIIKAEIEEILVFFCITTSKEAMGESPISFLRLSGILFRSMSSKRISSTTSASSPST
eukprot:TRINITY_DN5459_c0_g1_i1.p1 TRINITY_DN5459_c0_g1~~TRINITY_DN5459_c0_g1_i1.p1  ORF type:complete len:154 (-),score=20.74 TRINITY_DN5459_c0_g1_i1:152-613(-)